MAGPLGWDPASCVLVFSGKPSGVASAQSPLLSSQIPFLSLKKWLCHPQEKPSALGEPSLRSCHQTPLSVSWDKCQAPGILAGDVESPCSAPICSEWGREARFPPTSHFPEPQALWMSGFSEMKNQSPVKQVFLLDRDRI